MAEILGMTASIITVLELSTAVIKYIGGVREANSDRDRVLQEINISALLLRQVKDNISRVHQNNPQDPWLFSVSSMCSGEESPLEFFKIALEILLKKFKPPSGMMKVGVILKWPFAKGEILSLLGAIERQKNTFAIALEMDHMNLTRAVFSNLTEAIALSKSIDAIVSSVQGDTKSILRKNQEADEMKICEWLSTYSYQKKHNDTLSSRMKNTGEWLLETKEYREWRDNTRSNSGLLWCSGIPGAGKTVMASIMIEDLFCESRKNGSVVSYFYCDAKERELQDATSMIACLLRQMATARGFLPPNLIDLYEDGRKFHKSIQTKELDAVASIICREYIGIPIYVVIDALDECDAQRDRRHLLKFLDSIKSQARILITSRTDLVDVDKFMKNAARITIEATLTDLRRFVKEQIDGSEEFESLFEDSPAKHDELKGYITTKVIENAKGMFLLPTLQLQSILNQGSIADVRRATDRLPTDLWSFYEQTLLRIQERPQSELAMRALMWIVLAKRKLSSDQILHALATRIGQVNFDKEDLTTLRKLTPNCLGLLTDDKQTNEVRLVHLSLQEYLLERKDDLFPNAELLMAKTCLTYLSFKEFQEKKCNTSEIFDQRQRSYPFLSYAASCCGSHWLEAGDPQDHKEAFNFLRDSELVNHLAFFWYWADFPVGSRPKLFPHTPRNWTGLHGAAGFGLPSTTRSLIKEGIDVSAQNTWGRSPLHLACQEGHIDIVKQLIAAGADIHSCQWDNTPSHLTNHEGTFPWMRIGSVTPLHVAAEKGHENICRLLLESGARIDAVTSDGDTALNMVVFGNRSIATAKVLIEYQINVESTTTTQEWSSRAEDNGIRFYKGETALHEAAIVGDASLIELLLDHGANLDPKDEQGCTPLLLSIIKGHENAASCLMEHSADINVTDVQGRGPLYFAAKNAMDSILKKIIGTKAVKNKEQELTFALKQAVQNGKLSTCRILVESGASVATTGSTELISCLQAEHENEPLEIVRYLIDQSTDVNTLTEDGESALSFAVHSNWVGVVRLLLQAGAAVKTEPNDTLKLLNRAIWTGSDELIQILIDSEAPQANDEDGWTLLHSLLRSSREHEPLKIFHSLLDHGASIDVQDIAGDTPLKEACGQGWAKIAKALLDRGASVDLQACDGSTALHSAIKLQNIELVKIILSKNPSLDLEEFALRRFYTPLFTAIMIGNLEIVQILVQADPSSLSKTNRNGQSPFEVACMCGRVHIMRYLLSVGPLDLEMRTLAGATPLMTAAYNGWIDAVEFLLDCGAEINALDYQNWNALRYAVFASRTESAAFLLKAGIDKNQADRANETPLATAIAARDMPMVELLLEQECDFSIKSSYWLSPLDMACHRDFYDAASRLVELNAAPTTKDRFLNTTLNFCLMNKSSRCLQLVLDLQKLNFDTPNIVGNRPIHVVNYNSENGLETLNTLLRAGCRVDVTNRLKKSPLHTAVEAKSELNIKRLLEKGCDPLMKDHRGSTALDLIQKMKEDSKLYDNANVETIAQAREYQIVDEYERSIEKLRRVVNYLQARRRKSMPSLDLLNTALPQDPLKKLQRAVERWKITTRPFVYWPEDLTQGHIQAKTDASNPEHLLRKLRRIYRLLENRLNKESAIRNSTAGYQLIADIEEQRHVDLQAFLSQGVEINFQDADGVTAIYAAASVGRDSLVSQCLQAGADPNITNNFGNSPLQVAVREGEVNVVGALLKSPIIQVNTKDNDGYTPLHMVGQSRQFAANIIEALLDAGADLNARSDNNVTPICWAAYSSSEDAFHALMDHNPDIYLPNKIGFSALHFAMQESNFSILYRILEEKNVNFDIEDNDGDTPFLTASQHCAKDIVEGIVSSGCNVKKTNNAGRNCLHFAARNKFDNTFSFLLEYTKLDPRSAATDNGNTALHLACEAGIYETVLLLLDYGINVNSRVQTPTSPQDQSGPDDKTGPSEIEGRTPLMEAATGSDGTVQHRVMRLLLLRGASINAVDAKGQTALMLCVQQPNLSLCVKYLLLNGADVHIRDSNGSTALHKAIHQDSLNTIHYLLDHGADVHIADNQGKTARDVAEDEILRIKTEEEGRYWPGNCMNIVILAERLAEAAGETRVWDPKELI